MVFIQITRYERQIFTLGRKVFRKSSILNGSGRTDVKIGHMPILNQTTQGAGGLKSLKLS